MMKKYWAAIDGGHLLTDKTGFRIVALTILFMLAILVRIYGVIWMPAFDFGNVNSDQITGFAGKHGGQMRPVTEVSPTRSYHSSLIARYFYYRGLDSTPNWKKDIVNAQVSKPIRPSAADHCPPAMAWLASFAYLIAGEEYEWIPQILALLIWIIGGGLIYVICRKFCGFEAAYVASALFLLIPFGIYTSRNFLPDSLWLITMLASLLTIIRYSEKTTTSRFAICAIASALASFIKPLSILYIFAVYISLFLARHGKKRLFIDWRSWLFYIATVIPPSLYYIHVKAMAGNEPGFAKKYFIWELLKEKFFYDEMFFFIHEVISWPLLFAGAAGVILFNKRGGRFFIGSLWIVIFFISIAFNHSINTFHDYYQLQFIPIVALSLGLLTESIVPLLRKWKINHYVQVSICGILVLLTMYTLRPVRWNIQKADLTSRKILSQQLGEIVNHSSRTIFLAPSFGNPLMYDAWIAGKSWPTGWRLWKQWTEREPSVLVSWSNFKKQYKMNIDEAQKLFDAEYKKINPEYFIVTDFEEFQEQPGLKEFLTKHFPVLASTDWYIVFDLRCRNST